MAQPAPAPVEVPTHEPTPKLSNEGISELVKIILGDDPDRETGQALAKLVIAIASAQGDSRSDLLDRQDSASGALYEICHHSTREFDDTADRFVKRMTRQLARSRFVEKKGCDPNGTARTGT